MNKLQSNKCVNSDEKVSNGLEKNISSSTKEYLNVLKENVKLVNEVLLSKRLKEYQKINVLENFFENIEIRSELIKKTASTIINECNRLTRWATDLKSKLNSEKKLNNYEKSDLLIMKENVDLFISELKSFERYAKDIFNYSDKLLKCISITKELDCSEKVKKNTYENFDKNIFFEYCEFIDILTNDLVSTICDFTKSLPASFISTGE